MATDNTCGDPWDAFNEAHPEGWAKEQAIDAKAVEIGRLNHEIMKMRVALQTYELEALHKKHFRESHPAVKDAWDQYRTVWKLAEEK